MHWLKKYFIPHEANGYKPHFLRSEVAFAVIALILIVEGAFLSQALLFGRGTGFLALILPNTLVDETNQSRIASNLGPLTEDPLLTAAAQKKANDMAANGYFAHTSPAGLSPWYWFQQVGYKYTYAGENLAVNFSDSQDVTNAWLNSPEHRANIMNEHYTQIGIATAQGTYQGEPTIFVVQLFGRPAAVAKAAPAPTTPPVVAVKPVVQPAPTPSPTPVQAPVPVTTPAPAPTPVVAATQPPSQANAVAVQGAATESPAPAASAAAGPAAAPSAAANTPATPSTPAPAAAQESNLVQRIFSAPRLTANVIYAIVGFLVLLALILNIFIKVGVQHPRLVLNGIMILLVLGTLAIFNQHLLLTNAQIF